MCTPWPGNLSTKFNMATGPQMDLQQSFYRRRFKAHLYSGGGGGGHTFACGGATVVFEVRAVFPLVVVRASAVVVRGQVEAGRSVLTGVGGAIIDVQLRERTGRRGGEVMLDFLSAAVNRARPRSILPAGCARKQHTHAVKGGGARLSLPVWASAWRNVYGCSQEQLQQSPP